MGDLPKFLTKNIEPVVQIVEVIVIKVRIVFELVDQKSNMRLNILIIMLLF